MKLGVLVETEEGLDWAHWRQTFLAAERLGFDSVWLSDHLDSPWTPGQRGLDPFVALSVALVETTRVRVGTLVSPVTFHHAPILARTAVTLHALAPRRFVLGLGLGWNRDEHRAHGVPFPAAKERVSILRDVLDRIGDMPVLLGGSGDATLAMVRERANAWNVTTASPARFAELSSRLASTRAIEKSIATGVLIGRDERELHARRERLMRIVKPLTDTDPEAMGWIVGPPTTVVERLRALAAVGVDVAILGHYDLDDVDTLELIASDVLPSLR